MPRSLRTSGILLVAVLAAPACGGPEEAGGLEMRTEPISWSPGGFVLPHDYLFITGQPKNAFQAPFSCAAAGGSLVTIDSAAELAFIQTQEQLHGGGSWWIGYSDARVEGLWEWPNGNTNGFVNWQPGQPVNVDGTEDCAAMDAATGQWTAMNCNGVTLNYVCERGLGSVHTTGTIPFSVTNTNTDTQNYLQFSVAIVHVGINVGTCGVGTASFTGDTVLRLFNPNGVEVTNNDDACGTPRLGSNLTFATNTCPFGCSYTVHVGCYADSACSGTVAYEVF